MRRATLAEVPLTGLSLGVPLIALAVEMHRVNTNLDTSPEEASSGVLAEPALTKPGQAKPTQAKLDALESLRGFAAMYVVAGHFCNVYFHNPSWALPFRFAAEAVILFFLLSGFVIRYSTKDSTGTGEYAFKRFRRIYPLFFLSLVLSYCLHSLTHDSWASVDPAQVLGNIFMLQDFGYGRPGVWVDQFHNDALWSLSYECWFYVFFLAIVRLFSSDTPRTLAVGAAALFAYGLHMLWPNQFSYFVTHFAIWWAGADLAREFRAKGDVTIKRHLPIAGFLLVMAGLWGFTLLQTPRSQWAFGLYPMMELRRFAFAGLMVIVGLLFYKFAWNRGGSRLFAWTFGPFKYLAPISYGIYIFHFPIVDALAHSPLGKNALAYLVVSLILILAFAYVMEIKLQGWINDATEPVLDRLRDPLPKS